jgi:CRISPR-associated endonuclease/helicase Cas3
MKQASHSASADRPLYARSKGSDPSDWQTLPSHLGAVAAQAARFAAPFASSDWGWNAGWMHDLGKATSAFQHYMKTNSGLDDPEYGADGSVSNHASAGASWAHDDFGLPGKVLAYAIAGHHAGLPDYQPNETGNAAFVIRLKEGRGNLATILDFATHIRPELRPLTKPPSFVTPDNFHFWMRMLFSCLVDADRLNSEEFGDADKSVIRRTFPILGSLAPLLFQSLESLEEHAPPSEVNRIRSEIRLACETAAEKPPGLFSLSVPTGGGKTLSAMAFAATRSNTASDGSSTSSPTRASSSKRRRPSAPSSGRRMSSSTTATSIPPTPGRTRCAPSWPRRTGTRRLW